MNVNLILSKEKYHIGFFDSFAIYRKKFNLKIFTDITTTVKQSYSPNTGK